MDTVVVVVQVNLALLVSGVLLRQIGLQYRDSDGVMKELDRQADLERAFTVCVGCTVHLD